MISQQDYKNRRAQLAAALPADSIAFIPAASEVLRNGDAIYRFRQNSHFLYLTGFEEPDAVLVISSGKDGQSTLFNRPRNPAEEQWTGKRLGQEGALDQLGLQAAYAIEDLDTRLPELLAGKSSVYYALGQHPALEKKIMQGLQRLKSQIRRGVKAPSSLNDLDPIVSEMRLIKSDGEIALMRQAAKASVAAHLRAIRFCSPTKNEYDLEAELFHEFIRHGCRNAAYDPIIGGGENACVLHYTDNNKPLQAGDLVLIDAGCEYQGYAADITRTFPVNGKFSPEQKSIYELVLKAQQAGIDVIKPGVLWNRVQQVILEVLTQGLCELGLLQGSVPDLIAKEAYKPFYMHNSGHWLGLDVHDCGSYKIEQAWRPFEPGMVLTVEPGLYISSGTPGVDKRWWGIGVRIEDDVLVTKSGHEVLTAELPVALDEIEALMRG